MTTGRLTQEPTEVLFCTDAKGRVTQVPGEVLFSTEATGRATHLVIEVLYVPGPDAPAVPGVGGGKGVMFTRPLPGAQGDIAHPYGRGNIGAWLCRDGAGTQLIDYSLFRNHGVLVDMPARAWQHSKPGWCLEFAEADDIVRVASNENLRVGPGITCSAWVLANSTQALAGIVGDWGGSGDPLSWLLRTAAADDTLEFVVKVSDTDFVATQSAGSFPVGVWTHVVGTWGAATDNNVTLVINGGEEVVVGDNTPGPIQAGGQKVHMGQAGGVAFPGRLRDVLLYNRGMTAREAAAIVRLHLDEVFFPWEL